MKLFLTVIFSIIAASASAKEYSYECSFDVICTVHHLCDHDKVIQANFYSVPGTTEFALQLPPDPSIRMQRISIENKDIILAVGEKHVFSGYKMLTIFPSGHAILSHHIYIEGPPDISTEGFPFGMGVLSEGKCEKTT